MSRPPRWLAGKSYRDVTDQYFTTSEVTIGLTEPAPQADRFAYLCVFNGGQWAAIHWSRIKNKTATFDRMGRDIAYLPAYYHDDTLVPAAAPFILNAAGDILPLSIDGAAETALTISATTPAIPDADTHSVRPAVVVTSGTVYELFHWNNDWVSAGRQTAINETVSFDAVPAGGLYWLVADDSRRLERIFTIDGDRQIWW